MTLCHTKKRHDMSKVARSKAHQLPQMQRQKVRRAVWSRASGRRGEPEVLLNLRWGMNLWLWHSFPKGAGKGFFSRHVVVWCIKQTKDVFGEAAVPFSAQSCSVQQMFQYELLKSLQRRVEIHFMLMLKPHQCFADAGAQAIFFSCERIQGIACIFSPCTTPQNIRFNGSKLVRHLELCFSDNVQIKDTSCVVLAIFK